MALSVGGSIELVDDELRDDDCQWLNSRRVYHHADDKQYGHQGELQPPEGGGFNLRLESRLSC